MKNTLINSGLAAFVLIVIFLIMNAINPKLNFAFTINLVISSVVYLFFLIRAGFHNRKNKGGYLGFGEAFINALSIYALVSFLFSIFFFIMLNINPELMKIAETSYLEMMESGMRMTGLSEEQIALQMEQQGTLDMEKALSWSSSIMGWFGSLIFPGMIYVLITTFITKKKAPEETKEEV